MQLPLAGNYRALVPNCSQFCPVHLVAGRVLKQSGWWFWSSLGLHHAAVCFTDGSSICFYSSLVQQNLYSFNHSRVNPWMKSLLGLTCQLFHYPKMNLNHIPVLNHTLFSLHIHMQSIAHWRMLL